MLRKVLAALAVLCTVATLAPTSFAQPPKMEAHKMGKMEKKGPARDAKGRFVKKTAAPAGKMEKKGPARDPKTGRFMKKSDKKM
jgi:hypothetical protein